MPKVKGTHNAMKSGMIAAEAIFEALTKEENSGKAVEPVDYEKNLKNSWVWKELMEVRNVRPSFNTPLGIYGTIVHTTLSIVLGGREPWTLSHHGADHTKLKPAKDSKPITYPKPDNKVH